MWNPLNSSNTDPLSTRLKNRRVGRKVRKINKSDRKEAPTRRSKNRSAFMLINPDRLPTNVQDALSVVLMVFLFILVVVVLSVPLS